VLASRRDLPAELLQHPAQYRGATWTAVCGPATEPTTRRARVATKFNRLPARSGLGVFQPSQAAWEFLNTRPRGTRATNAFTYGGKDDAPVVGDWDGDGVDTVGIYRRSDNRFLLKNSNNPGPPDLSIPFGRPGDIPIVGDWDGDGLDNIGVFRPSEAVFLLGGNAADQDATVRLVVRFGEPWDVPISGDWDGDGIDKIGVFHPATATFYLRASNEPEDLRVTTVALGRWGQVRDVYGIAGDEPVIGDWDGDGIDKIGVYRPSQQLWYLAHSNKTSTQHIRAIAFGRPGDRPVAGAWQGSSWWALE
jgi:ribosomal protein S16